MAPKLSRIGKAGREGFKKLGIKTDDRTTQFEYIRRLGGGPPKGDSCRFKGGAIPLTFL